MVFSVRAHRAAGIRIPKTPNAVNQPGEGGGAIRSASTTGSSRPMAGRPSIRTFGTDRYGQALYTLR
jgi:hypothetical protein